MNDAGEPSDIFYCFEEYHKNIFVRGKGHGGFDTVEIVNLPDVLKPQLSSSFSE